MNVSGGQKLRISLARAAYSDAQFVLLDDPFSAVDAPTAKHLLNNCICSPLFEGRTVILVTHAIGLVLPAAEHVILLQDGKINYSGKPANLKGVEIQLGLGDANSESKSIETESETTQNNDLLKALGTDLELSFKGKLVEKEFKQTGSVRSDVYRSYFTAAGGLLYFIFYMLTFIAIVSSEALFNWWIKKWTESPSQSNVFYYIKYYILFGVLILLSTNVNLICQISGAINAAKRLHLNLITRVLGAPMRFFEITPLGRLLNRFSKDISGIDSYFNC